MKSKAKIPLLVQLSKDEVHVLQMVVDRIIGRYNKLPDQQAVLEQARSAVEALFLEATAKLTERELEDFARELNDM